VIPVLPGFLVLHQATTMTVTEELVLVRVLLCSTYLLRPPLPSAVGIFKVLFSTSFESDTVWPFLTIWCYLLSILMCHGTISSFSWCKCRSMQQESPSGFSAP